MRERRRERERERVGDAHICICRHRILDACVRIHMDRDGECMDTHTHTHTHTTHNTQHTQHTTHTHTTHTHDPSHEYIHIYTELIANIDLYYLTPQQVASRLMSREKARADALAGKESLSLSLYPHFPHVSPIPIPHRKYLLRTSLARVCFSFPPPHMLPPFNVWPLRNPPP